MLPAAPASPPLRGLRVVELATVIAAPSAAMLLCGMGADVIKVESAGAGDSWRYDGLQTGRQPSSSLFEQANRGKRSVVLDITTESGLAAIKALIGSSDVFVTNVREKSLAKRGLDYEALHATFPRLIYAHLSG